MKSKLKNKRLEKEISVNKLHLESGVSRQTIINIESGKTKVAYDYTLKKLANVLDCKIEDLK